MACSHPHHRIGWSFVELMIVICILVALLAIGFVVWGMLRSRAAISSTHTLVSSVATQLTTYSTKIWTWQEA
ncbi:MAG: hypothetical protein H0W78_11145 [Planctomycetes bacterium]|nr:hypothetical protein [Planctomycetota bacterium]